jgi:cyclopropane-fatty-acyl-phospholipid synthase
MSTGTRLAFNWVEQGLVPDIVIRQGIRRLCARRLEQIAALSCETAVDDREAFVRAMDGAPIAFVPERANDQHYEVPAAFFDQVLGSRRKYSCCYWPNGVTDLDGAEAAALRVTCERADLADGQGILDLGCGWGSLSLWMAEHYPNARVVAVSNSSSQRRYIETQAAKRGLSNLRVVTADMNAFHSAERFDRVVSLEMFEHMRNWRTLFRRIHGWLRPGGRFFMHVFCHRDTPYLFEDNGEDDWMSRHFFTGGMMPSDDLALHFQDRLALVRQWRWSGLHYQKTANAWLSNMDRRRDAVLPILAECYGADQAALWWQRWRLFFMACAETFGYEAGERWWVSHYLFERSEEAL